jgi:hypothetical protein
VFAYWPAEAAQCSRHRAVRLGLCTGSLAVPLTPQHEVPLSLRRKGAASGELKSKQAAAQKPGSTRKKR